MSLLGKLLHIDAARVDWRMTFVGGGEGGSVPPTRFRLQYKGTPRPTALALHLPSAAWRRLSGVVQRFRRCAAQVD